VPRRKQRVQNNLRQRIPLHPTGCGFEADTLGVQMQRRLLVRTVGSPEPSRFANF
jgi:hypothetical protein